MDRLYLDAAATTPVRSQVQEAIMRCLRADPPAQRRLAGAALEQLRGRLGAAFVVPTASGSAANNLALTALAAEGARLGRRHLLTQPTEHPSVLRCLEGLESAGFELELLPVTGDGRVVVEAVGAALRPETALVSVMRANHETGVVQPTAAIGALCRAAGVPLHVDAVQALRWLPDTLGSLQADALSVSGHKLNGPKGVGLLATGRDLDVTAPPVPAAALVGLAEALELRAEALGSAARVAASRDALQAALLAALPEARVNGGGERLPGHLSLSIPGISGEALVLTLDRAGVAASSGAACASGTPGPSPVLLALGRSPAEATGSLRLSLPEPLEPPDRERVVAAVREEVNRLQSLGMREAH